MTNLGGNAHVVQWQADEAAPALFETLINDRDMPALPDCQKLPGATAATAIGC